MIDCSVFARLFPKGKTDVPDVGWHSSVLEEVCQDYLKIWRMREAQTSNNSSTELQFVGDLTECLNDLRNEIETCLHHKRSQIPKEPTS